MAEARTLRDAFPDPSTLRRVNVCDIPPATAPDDERIAALRYLRDEMDLVRDGTAWLAPSVPSSAFARPLFVPAAGEEPGEQFAAPGQDQPAQ